MGNRNQKGRLTLKGGTVKWIRDLKRPIAVKGSQSACASSSWTNVSMAPAIADGHQPPASASELAQMILQGRTRDLWP